MEHTLQLISVFVGSLGFALIFHVKRERLLLASLGGLLGWAVYLLSAGIFPREIPRYFVAAVAVTVYAEILARLVKCPATVFLVSGAVPLFPGGFLYRAMSSFMAEDYSAFTAQGLQTVMIAVAIAVGMLCPMSLFQLVRRARQLAGRNITRDSGGTHHV